MFSTAITIDGLTRGGRCRQDLAKHADRDGLTSMQPSPGGLLGNLSTRTVKGSASQEEQEARGKRMKKIIALLVGLSLLTFHTVALAAGQEAECEALVQKCLAMFKDKGRPVALAAISNPRGPFIKGELYVFALSLENVMLAHPYDKSLHGINLTKVRDTHGHRFFEKFGEIAATTGSGWVGYTWNRPGHKVPVKKRSYITRVPHEDVYIGCGYYVK